MALSGSMTECHGRAQISLADNRVKAAQTVGRRTRTYAGGVQCSEARAAIH